MSHGFSDDCQLDSAIDTALARAVLLETISQSLRPPGDGALARLAGDEARAVLGGACGLLGLPADAAESLLDAARTADPERLATDHLRLFGHTARGRVSPYETEYGASAPFRQSQELADIGGFYSAFGLAPRNDRHERGDHLAMELEFLAFLAAKESYHLQLEDREPVDELRRAQRLFLREHLGRFGLAVARSLGREAQEPFFASLGELCFSVLSAECRRFEVQPGPELLPLRPTAEPEAPMMCGSCALHERDDAAEGASR
jgi:TorA maturation chaperone TorD